MTALAVLAFSTVASVARAQTQPMEDDPRRTARMHAGPFHFTPTILLKELGTDSNVFNSSEQPESDFGATLTPGGTLWVSAGRRLLWRAGASADLVYFQKHVSERSVNPSVSTQLDLVSKRFTVFAGASHEDTRVRPNFEIDARSRRLEDGAGGGVAAQVTAKVALEVAGAWRRTLHDADAVFLGTSLPESLNRVSQSGTLTARFRHSPLTTFVVAGEVMQDRFLISRVRNSDTIRVVGGVDLKPRALISGRARVGVRNFAPKDVQVAPFRGLVAAANLMYRPYPYTEFRVEADRDLQYSFEPTQLYYVVNGVGGGIRQGLVGRFDIDLGAKRYVSNYSNLDAAGALRSDVTHNYQAEIGYTIRRGTRLSAGVAYWQRDSSVTARGYHATRLVTRLSSGL